MRFQRDFRNLSRARGIDHGNTAIAISNIDALIGPIDKDVVGVLSQLDPSRATQIGTSQQPKGSIATVCDVQRVRRSHVAETLRFPQATYRLQHVPGLEIDDSDAVIAELGDVEVLPLRIDRQVIQSPADVFQDDRRFEHKRLDLGGDRVALVGSEQANYDNQDYGPASRGMKSCRLHIRDFTMNPFGVSCAISTKATD